MRIGFIGAGNMGGPMCRNLTRNVNHEVVVFDLDPKAVEACVAAGAKPAGSLAALTGSCEVIFTSLPTPRHVEAVVNGPGGIAAEAKPGAVFFDLSTNAPSVVKRLEAELKAKGITMLDSPVTGGVPRAEDASIVIMVGGDEAAFEAHRPLLKAFSGTIVHTGPIGSASVAKLINNMMVLCNSAVAMEAMAIATMSGVDMKKVAEIVSNGSGDSFAFRNLMRRGLGGEFKASFALDLAYKDLHLALELGDELGVPLPQGSSTHNLQRLARGMKLGSSDSSSILRVYETALGRTVKQ
jgi:3-hydroxyisobutyrate dehydrogenase-like beta-hydroxyacid dehydrogenase